MKRSKEELIKEFGFVTIYRCDHLHRTEGLTESYGHPELELRGQYIEVPGSLAHELFSIAASNIKSGKVYLPDQNYDEFLNRYHVRIIRSEYGLRMILPDKTGRVELPMSHPYCHQYDPVLDKEEHEKLTMGN